ncbi:MAG: GGDEF domain-containing protein [Burkholderiaceae bacterium]|nr:GGDEF domain-containing protein [Burkholderiaceae bacterium]
MASDKTNQQNPAEIAREAFRRLAARRIAPTPDGYRKIYNEIAGTVDQPGPENILDGFAHYVSELPGETGYFGQRLKKAVAERDWEEYGKQLTALIEKVLAAAAANNVAAKAAPAPASVPAQAPAPSLANYAAGGDDQQIQLTLLRDMLTRTLTFSLASLLQSAPVLAEEAEALGALIKEAKSGPLLNDAAARLKQLSFKIEMRSGDMAEEHELLLQLFRLLLENVTELLENDSWLSGQVAGVQAILTGPISHAALKDATRSLKEVIYKQGMLKHSLNEAKATIKNMMITFIDQLAVVASSTGDYHEKIDKYSQKISQAKDITELNKVLEDVMRDTRSAQTEALRSRDTMLSTRRQVQDAEARIHELESKLEEMSELVREDQLTGSLNRRGLDDVFEREFARTERNKKPLCIAMLDLDDFKRLNDTHGHSAGDEVLVHLVRVIKDTLRTMDVIGRFGGEEFVIVLPDTSMEDAMQTVTRLQRELTKRIFMHNDERLLITFSAGVALRAESEDQSSLIKRADEALYKAKRAGKNRVVAAD